MQLQRTRRRRSPISLVSMIDVLMIMLVFFMVTSTYLDLDMMPMLARSDEPTDPPSPGQAPQTMASGALIVRLAADDRVIVRGQSLTATALSDLLTRHRTARPDGAVIVLPSTRASTQGLVSLMDAAALAGVRRLRLVRLEGQP